MIEIMTSIVDDLCFDVCADIHRSHLMRMLLLHDLPGQPVGTLAVGPGAICVICAGRSLLQSCSHAPVAVSCVFLSRGGVHARAHGVCAADGVRCAIVAHLALT
jgi:hypothetical protein